MNIHHLISERVGDCCSTPKEQSLYHAMARISYFNEMMVMSALY